MILLYVLVCLLGIVLVYILFLFLCAMLVDPEKTYTEHSRFYRALLNGVTAIALWLLRIKVHTSGVDRIPTDTRLLFVSNHRSNFDPIVTWHALKRWQIAFVSKEGNFRIPIFGRIIRKCCFLPIDRESPRNAVRTINAAADLIVRDTVSIGIYPEGTRSKSGQLLPFHNSVFKIAAKAHVPIVVLSIEGTEMIRRNIPWRRSHVYLNVLDIISAETVEACRTNEIGLRVRTALEEEMPADRS